MDDAEKTKHMNTKMLQAAWSGSLKELKLLHRKGGDLNVSMEETKVTLLMLATTTGHRKVVRWLLEQGITNINAQNGHGMTALHNAIGHKDILADLIEHGADISILSNNGDSALHTAALSGQTEFIEEFVKLCKDVDIRNKNGETALMNCFMHAPQVEVEEEEVERVAAYITRETLMCAEILVQHGAAVLAQAENRANCLWFAVSNKFQSKDTLEWLLKHGAEKLMDVPVGENGDYPIHQAAKHSPQTLAVVIEHTKDLNVVDKMKRTPLMHAAACKHEECMKLLVESKANVNFEGEDKLTALCLASYGGFVQGVKFLLPFTSPEALKVALMIAVGRGEIECVRVLATQVGTVNFVDENGESPFLRSLKLPSFECAKVLLEEYKAIPEKAIEGGNTPMHRAALHGNVSALEELVKMGYDPEQANDKGVLPIHVAVMEGLHGSVQFLWNASKHKTAEVMISILEILETRKEPNVLAILYWRQQLVMLAGQEKEALMTLCSVVRNQMHTIEGACGFCGCSPGEFVQITETCPTCRKFSYCNQACREAHLPFHRAECKAIVVCAHCGKEEGDRAFRRCPKCKNAAYCTPGCQRKDKMKHKASCGR